VINQKLVDTQDIAQFLGVTRQWVTDSITKRPDFPKPVINISRKTRKWNIEDVFKWSQKGSQ
jgi:predicted DNA-binding transcriptional regulator AlpA